MKNLTMFLLACFCHFTALSQYSYERIIVSDDIELVKLSGNTYVHVSYYEAKDFRRFPSNGLVFINGNEAFLFDTPMTDSFTKDLVTFLQDSMQLKIKGFVPNHWHADCIGGLGFLHSQHIESYANQITIDIAKSKNLPVTLHGFQDSLQLHLGDKLIQCYYFGAAHSTDNIVVWIPSEKILFAGCMVKSMNSPDLGNTVDGDLTAYPNTIKKVHEKLPMAKIVVPGHGYCGGIELLKHTWDLSTK